MTGDRGFRARLRNACSDAVAEFWMSETAVTMAFALIMGVGTGLGTVVLIRLIALSEAAFWGGGQRLFGFLGNTHIALVPAVGGLLVGLMLYRLPAQWRGLDVADVIAAVATMGNRVQPLAVLAKVLASVVTIGSGGSAGREGPLVHMGAALGFTLGRGFQLNDRRVLGLVAAGAAGGVAATFNAPLAGIMFALEVILSEFGLRTFGALVIAVVAASGVSRSFLGPAPAFPVAGFTEVSAWELGLYIGLGLSASIVAVAFSRLLSYAEGVFSGLSVPRFLKPALGGLGVGVVGLMAPQVFGMGFQTIEDALRGNLGLGLLLALLAAKMLATALTLGSGSAGGIIAPALFLGAMLGGAYGHVAHAVLPGVTAESGSYAIVGMAAVFAGAVRAPVTAVLLLFEMTQDHHIMLPLLLATLASTVASYGLDRNSIYTRELSRRGIDARARRSTSLMQTILVEDAMTPIDVIKPVPTSMTLADVANRFHESGHHGFVVVDADEELYGVVTLADVERAMTTGRANASVGDICTRNVVTVFPDETLDAALRHFATLDVGRMPVVQRTDVRHVVGLLRRSDVVRAYSRALAEPPDDHEQVMRARLQAAVGAELVELVLGAQDAAVGRRLREIGLPPDSVIISIHRRGKVVIPRGNAQLQEGDRVVILKVSTSADKLRSILREGTTE